MGTKICLNFEVDVCLMTAVSN